MKLNRNSSLAWSICLLTAVVWLASGARPSVIEAGTPKKSGTTSVAGCGSAGMLDLIVQGPFVFDNNSDGFVLLGPDVHNTHDRPTLNDLNISNPKSIEAGDYTLTIDGTTQPSGPQICNPVGGSQLMVVSGKTEKLRSDPGVLHSLSVSLPIPTEIVPWNADPMQISTVSSFTNGSSVPRIATMVILRYPYKAGAQIKFEGKEKVTGAKVSYSVKPVVSGSESFVAIVQREHEDDSADHAFAQDAFEKMIALEPPLKRYIAFSSVSGDFGSNLPLIDGVEPKDLTDYLNLGSDSPSDRNRKKNQKGLKSSGLARVYIYHLHNDCKASIIYADYTK